VVHHAENSGACHLVDYCQSLACTFFDPSEERQRLKASAVPKSYQPTHLLGICQSNRVFCRYLSTFPLCDDDAADAESRLGLPIPVAEPV